jgi:hypothetical protein
MENPCGDAARIRGELVKLDIVRKYMARPFGLGAHSSIIMRRNCSPSGVGCA